MLDGSEKFTFGGDTYTAQQAYNAAGWLANRMVANLGNTTTQTNYAFAIWDIFDGQTTDPDGGATTMEQNAFTAVADGYVANNVSVFTPDGPVTANNPNPKDASQEFLVVRPAPEIDATAATGALTLLFGGALVLGSRRKHQV